MQVWLEGAQEEDEDIIETFFSAAVKVHVGPLSAKRCVVCVGAVWQQPQQE